VKLYEIILKPLSGFGTPLRGDTLFGHFCWQAAYDSSLMAGGLTEQLTHYADRPMAIFSSAFFRLNGDSVRYILKRPDLPFSLLLGDETDRKSRIEQAKAFKKKKWVELEPGLTFDSARLNCLSDEELSDKFGSLNPATPPGNRAVMTSFSRNHNSINRLTQTTGGGGMFAPYSKEDIFYHPAVDLVVFVLVDERATDISSIVKALERIGRWGYGRDASTGMGRFTVLGHYPLPIPDPENAEAFYALAPCVPHSEDFKKVYFKPFIRYGKHGDRLATSVNPFKNPVIMIDEGAVLFPKSRDAFSKPYVGRAVTGVSKVKPETVVQGYAPCLPMILERGHENPL